MRGWIKTWYDKNGFGWIYAVDGNRYFVHGNDLVGRHEKLRGLPVTFGIGYDEQNRIKAVNVEAR